MSDFMEWAEGDDFITEDTDVRDSCESAWDAAWAQQDFRIAELKTENAELRASLSWAMTHIPGDFDRQDTELQNAMYNNAEALQERGDA